MSEIDFAEIEKAMAELVNKAQGKERQKGLHVVANERSQKAKEAETAHEQGDIATKRIIVASNNMRTNPHPRQQTVHNIQPNPRRVMDFMPPANNTANPHMSTLPELQEERIDDRKDESLNKTVGELSNEYLLEKVSEDNLAEPEHTTPLESEADTKGDEDIEQNTQIEDIVGPSPVMSVIQEPTMSTPSTNKSNIPKKDELPAADDLAEEVGKVHKIYGQRLPKEYLTKPKNKYQEKSKVETKVKRPRSRKGFTFYFVVLMVLTALAMWGAAIYLYLNA